MKKSNSARPFSVAGAIILAATAVLVSAPAHAATTSSSTTTVLDPSKDCWADVSTQNVLCVDPGQDLRAAVKADYGLTIATSDQAVKLEKSATVASPAAVTVQIGILYNGSGYTGTTWTVTETDYSGGCTNGHQWAFNNLPVDNPSWDNAVSSVHSYSNCFTTLYDKINQDQSGGEVTAAPDLSSLGAMNNAASSILWF